MTDIYCMILKSERLKLESCCKFEFMVHPHLFHENYREVLTFTEYLCSSMFAEESVKCHFSRHSCNSGMATDGQFSRFLGSLSWFVVWTANSMCEILTQELNTELATACLNKRNNAISTYYFECRFLIPASFEH